MLKVVDEGVEIILQGKDKRPLLFPSLLLVLMAAVVAAIAMTMPVKFTLGAFFGLALCIFIFNHYKHRLKTRSYFGSGCLLLKRRQFIIGAHSVTLSDAANIMLANDMLIVKDLGRVWYFSGFATQQESHIAKAVLEGVAVEQRECVISLAGSQQKQH